MKKLNQRGLPGKPKPHLAIGDDYITREEALKTPSPYMTLAECCVYLRCGTAHLYRMLDNFQTVKFGKKTLVVRASVDAYLAAHPFKRVSSGKAA